MVMKKKWGEAGKTAPEGFRPRRVLFEPLCWVDQATPDGRTLTSAGMKDPYLPATVFFLDVQGPGGHEKAQASGRLDEVTLHEDGRVTGIGWLADNEIGAKAEFALETRMVGGNSVDLRDTEIAVKFPSYEDYDEGPDGYMSMPKIAIRFDSWALGATTIVATPAFGKAAAVLSSDEEITASFTGTEITFSTSAFDRFEEEITAAASGRRPLPSWEAFHRPESDHPHKVIVGEPDEFGICEVYGHLGTWDSCHDGFLDRCVRIPRSPDGYSSFCKPGVLTDKGQISTGPFALYGGHPRGPLDVEKVEEAYGNIENAWCDVRVTDGRFGPWVSGLTRPGVAEEKIYAARASRLSGHWKGGKLRAVVSVNTEGYDIPDIQFSDVGGEFDLIASFAGGGCTEDQILIPAEVFAGLFDEEDD